MKLIVVLFALTMLTGCGVNMALRIGVDIDPGLERLTSDIRQIMDEQKGESNE